jgi:hypothetical protein
MRTPEEIERAIGYMDKLFEGGSLRLGAIVGVIVGRSCGDVLRWVAGDDTSPFAELVRDSDAIEAKR